AGGGSVVEAIRVVDDCLTLRADAASFAPVFAAQVSSERECHLVQKSLWAVIVFDLNTVIRVNAAASKLPISATERILTHPVVIEHQRQPWLGTPENLPAQSRLAAQPAIGLPTVDDPGLDLQFVFPQPLNPKPLPKPRTLA